MPEVQLRRARLEDTQQVNAIFSHYVLNSVATYYTEPPPDDHFKSKIQRSLADERFPFFVAIDGDTIVGYAYGAEYRTYAAYYNSIEDSIYIRPEYQRRGIGKMLLRTLIDECKKLGYRTIISVFGAGEDMLPGTFHLHQSFGFKETGRLRGVGEKFGMILDTPILQLQLRD